MWYIKKFADLNKPVVQLHRPYSTLVSRGLYIARLVCYKLQIRVDLLELLPLLKSTFSISYATSLASNDRLISTALYWMKAVVC